SSARRAAAVPTASASAAARASARIFSASSFAATRTLNASSLARWATSSSTVEIVLMACLRRPRGARAWAAVNALGRNVSTSPDVQKSMRTGGLLKTRLGKALVLGGALFVLIGGGAYAFATRDDFSARKELAGPDSSSTSPTTARPAPTIPLT